MYASQRRGVNKVSFSRSSPRSNLRVASHSPNVLNASIGRLGHRDTGRYDQPLELLFTMADVASTGLPTSVPGYGET